MGTSSSIPIPNRGKWKNVKSALSDSKKKPSDVGQLTLNAFGRKVSNTLTNETTINTIKAIEEFVDSVDKKGIEEALFLVGIIAVSGEPTFQIVTAILKKVEPRLTQSIFDNILKQSIAKTILDISTTNDDPTPSKGNVEKYIKNFYKDYGKEGISYSLLTNFLYDIVSYQIEKDLNFHLGKNKRFEKASSTERFREGLQRFCENKIVELSRELGLADGKIDQEALSKISREKVRRVWRKLITVEGGGS